MKCSFCGSELEPGAGFCPNCGTIISLDNEFVSPKQPDEPMPPAAPEADPVEPAAPEKAEAPAFEETLGGMPAYVSPTFDAYQPAQTIPETPPAPEDDDEDPFREMHPDLDDTPPAPPVVPAEAQIPDVQPVAADGDIPVYEPTEEIHLPEEAPEEEEAVDEDDMYVSGGKSKKGIVIAIVVILLLAAAAAGAWYYVKTQNPFLQPTVSQTDLVPDNTSQSDTTLPVSESASDTTEDTTEDSTEDTTGENTSDEDATDESATDESTSEDDATAISADENELTAPQDTTATTAPTTTEATTRPTTTTQRATTTTTRPTTTAPRTTTTTRATTQPTTRQTTTQAANTLQRPTRTFAARTMYISEDGVALRFAPRAGSGNRVSLSVGADVSVTAEENGYYYVYSNRYGLSGWVSKQYVGASRPVAQTQTRVSGLVQPDVSVNGGTKTVASGGTGLNLRKGPGTSYDVIRSIGDGYPVAVKGKSSTVSGWVYVTDITRGVSGWVAETYLK